MHRKCLSENIPNVGKDTYHMSECVCVWGRFVSIPCYIHLVVLLLMFMFPEHPLSYVLIVKSRRKDYWFEVLTYISHLVQGDSQCQPSSHLTGPFFCSPFGWFGCPRHHWGLRKYKWAQGSWWEHFVVRGDSIPTMTSSLSEPNKSGVVGYNVMIVCFD